MNSSEQLSIPAGTQRPLTELIALAAQIDATPHDLALWQQLDRFYRRVDLNRRAVDDCAAWLGDTQIALLARLNTSTTGGTLPPVVSFSDYLRVALERQYVAMAKAKSGW